MASIDFGTLGMLFGLMLFVDAPAAKGLEISF